MTANFPYECTIRWPYEWTYNQIEIRSIDDRVWLCKNVGSFGQSWISMTPHSPSPGLCTRYAFKNKEHMVLFHLTRVDSDG